MHTRAVAICAFLAVFMLVACQGPTKKPEPTEEKPNYETEGGAPATEVEPGVFFPGATYATDITKPETLIGHPVGAKPATPASILACFEKWSKESPRVTTETYATSFEGRDLKRVVVTSEANHAKLDEIKNALGRLADPRELSDTDAEAILQNTPPVAFLGFSIHGDELSGADASLAVGYHLIAGTDAAVTDLLDNVVVVIDPMMNPDGRQRAVSQIQETSGQVSNLDFSSMHRGRWPWGRGNHYLFDMNRDWFVGVAPETRGRWKNMLEFHPQLVVDVHEMWALDTYLFYPSSKPHNPHRPPHISKWHEKLAANHATMFDGMGISYYTREWIEGWYPGYTDAWSSMNSAVGMLYEQARYGGQSLRRPSGEIVTYFQSVHAQASSCMSDVKTLRDNRKAFLIDYLEGRKLPLTSNRAFAVVPGKNPDRERAFVTNLRRQGIEVYAAEAGFQAQTDGSVLGTEDSRRGFKEGTYIIPEGQPQGLLVRALLNFDIRFEKDVLERERYELERKHRSKIYDSTAWNLAQLHDLDGYWITTPRVEMKAIIGPVTPVPGINTEESDRPAYAWIVDGRGDASVAFAVAAMERDVRVNVSDIEFTSEGQTYPRGTILIRKAENDKDVLPRIEAAAKAAGVQVVATTTGRSEGDGPDLGGGHFRLLHRPRIAVLTNAPVSTSEFGHVWHHLDRDLGVPFTMMDTQRLGRYDLRRYNVLVIPPAGGMIDALLKSHKDKIKAWVQAGGTLVAMGRSAAALTSDDLKLGTVKLRRDVLLDLKNYQQAAQKDLAARNIQIDTDEVWGESLKNGAKQPEKAGHERLWRKKDEEFVKATKTEDEWKRMFSPKGAILRGLVNTDSWLTYGARDEIPVQMSGDYVYLAMHPATVPVRFAPRENLRLGGLLWPEAALRIALTGYATVERIGQGQVVYFAVSPVYRGHTKGTARLFSNAVIYGPSIGAKQPLVW